MFTITPITNIYDFITGQIYVQDCDTDSNKSIYIFRAKTKLTACTAIKVSDKSLKKETVDFTNFMQHPTYPASDEEVLWFEYCELHGKYVEKEEVLDYIYTKQFIREYLNEE